MKTNLEFEEHDEIPSPGVYLAIKQAAKLLNMSYGSVRNEIQLGKLRAYRFRGAFRIHTNDLATYIESCQVVMTPRHEKPLAPGAGAESSTFTHLDGARLLDAWRRRGVRADRRGGRNAPSSGSSCDPSTD